MGEVLVWMLVAVSASSNNSGNLQVVGHFLSSEKCEQVRRNIPSDRVAARCIQGYVLFPK